MLRVQTTGRHQNWPKSPKQMEYCTLVATKTKQTKSHWFEKTTATRVQSNVLQLVNHGMPQVSQRSRSNASQDFLSMNALYCFISSVHDESCSFYILCLPYVHFTAVASAQVENVLWLGEAVYQFPLNASYLGRLSDEGSHTPNLLCLLTLAPTKKKNIALTSSWWTRLVTVLFTTLSYK